MNKAVIFDMDGTLWDATKQVTDSWNIVFEKHENASKISYNDMQGAMGLMMDDIIKRFLPNCSIDEQKVILKECEEFENEYLCSNCGKLYDGLKEALTSLKNNGYKLMIVTNAQDGYVQAFFASSGLENLFDDYEMYGRTLLPKDENIKLILNRNNIQEAVYVGDTIWDYNSANKAGLPFVHASYGFGEIAHAKYKINTLYELVELVPKIFETKEI